MTSRRESELEAEIVRLREQLEVEKSRDVSGSDMGVAARVAITRLREQDFPEFVRSVESIPTIYRQEGRLAALAYVQERVSTMVDAMSLVAPRTPDLVRTQHRIHMLLNEGQAELLMLDEFEPEKLDCVAEAKKDLLRARLFKDPEKRQELLRHVRQVHVQRFRLLDQFSTVGARSRMELVRVVERYVYALAVRAAFSRGVETPAGIMPTTYGGGQG
jgi:hypothetical protein